MKIDSDLGDAWAFFYKFELQHGTEVSVCLGTGEAAAIPGWQGLPSPGIAAVLG